MSLKILLKLYKYIPKSNNVLHMWKHNIILILYNMMFTWQNLKIFRFKYCTNREKCSLVAAVVRWLTTKSDSQQYIPKWDQVNLNFDKNPSISFREHYCVTMKKSYVVLQAEGRFSPKYNQHLLISMYIWIWCFMRIRALIFETDLLQNSLITQNSRITALAIYIHI